MEVASARPAGKGINTRKDFRPGGAMLLAVPTTKRGARSGQRHKNIRLLTLSKAIGLTLLALLLSAPLHAQIDTGRILGRVTDASGAVIAQANVTLTNEGTNLTLTTKTASDGNYMFPDVKIGTFRVEIEAAGFQKFVRSATFKAGFQGDFLRYYLFAPNPGPRGAFTFGGTYTSVPNLAGGDTSIAQFLLTPIASTVGAYNNVGGANSVSASNIYESDATHYYFGLYL